MFERFADFSSHALVTARQDSASGLKALIAVHNDNRGPAIGGCRILPYATMADAVCDVLRLSRGMTYKTAIAGIPSIAASSSEVPGMRMTNSSPPQRPTVSTSRTAADSVLAKSISTWSPTWWP